jgi:predicted SAM-dependent methyltransferase
MKKHTIISQKLNVGCGPNAIENWINFDWGILPMLSKFTLFRTMLINLKILPKNYDIKWAPIKLVDIRRKFPLKNSSIKYIYCSHVIEHFERWEALRILKECYRVISEDGCIRMIVPDIEKMSNIYSNSINQDLNNRPAREFCRIWWGYDKDIKPKGLIQKIARRFIRDHYWNYDKYELNLLLKDAGFHNIKTVAFQEGSVPDIEKLDVESYRDHSLYMEATK